MTVIAGTNGCDAQRRTPRRDGWTKARRAIFLDELEASCNIRHAAAAAGMTDGTARALRRRDPDFAAAWATALDIGCERLRAELLERALRRRGDGETPRADERDGAEPMPMDDATRLRVLQICRASADGRQGRSAWHRAPPPRSAEQVFADLIAKLDRVESKMRADGKA